jgi:hypothetical protein
MDILKIHIYTLWKLFIILAISFLFLVVLTHSKTMKKEIGCFTIVLCCCGMCQAQQVVSSGGYAVKSEISVNWILGGSLSDIPAYDLSSLNKFHDEQLMESEITLQVYPMPATDFINIKITPVDTGRLIFELYNNSGVKILNKITATQPVIQVNVSDIPSGVYLLKVVLPYKNQLFGVQKIIKK